MRAQAAGDASALVKFDTPDARKIAKACLVLQAHVKITGDWSKWDPATNKEAPRQLFNIALQFNEGTAEAPRDRVLARRIMDYLTTFVWDGQATAQNQLQRMLLDPLGGPVEADRAIAMLTKSVGVDPASAAVVLAQRYETGTDVPVDPVKAAELFRIGAAAGSPQGAVGYARLLFNGSIPEPEKGAAANAVKVALMMLYAEVSRGACAGLRDLGNIYLTGAFGDRDPVTAAKWWTMADLAGDRFGTFQLAGFYLNGPPDYRNVDLGLKLLERAAVAGEVRAMQQLADSLLLGNGPSRDVDRALSWYERAGASGDVEALHSVAKIFRGDFGGKPDAKKSVEALLRASKLPGITSGIYLDLARAYQTGSGVAADQTVAISYFEQAARLGEAKALVEVAKLFIDGTDQSPERINRGVLALRQAAQQGNAASMQILSDVYRCGFIRGADLALSKRWSDRAASAGSAAALIEIANASRLEGSPEGLHLGFTYWKRAAKLGNREAMAALSLAYLNGVGTEPDPVRAKRWVERAVAPGEEQGQAFLFLARAYLQGQLVRRDLAQAEALLEQAIEDRDPAVRYELGAYLLRENLSGSSKHQRGLALLIRSANEGYSPSMKALADFGADAEAKTGRSAQGWTDLAVQQGDVEALLTAAEKSAGFDAAEPYINRARAPVGCEPDHLVRLARIYNKFARNADDFTEARTLLERATRLVTEDEQDLLTIARAFEAGIGGRPEPKRAEAFYERAAKVGNVEAKLALGTAYSRQEATAQSCKTAARWLSEAADASVTDAFTELTRVMSTCATLAPDAVITASAALDKGVRAGVPIAARELGKARKRGLGVDIDIGKAVELFKQAALAGDLDSMRELSSAYALGQGVQASQSESTLWLKKAADLGDPEAMYQYALSLEIGFGVASNPVEAKYWFDAAQARGRGVKSVTQ